MRAKNCKNKFTLFRENRGLFLDMVYMKASYILDAGIVGWADAVSSNASYWAVAPTVSGTAAGGEDGFSGGPEWTNAWSQDERTQLFQLPAARCWQLPRIHRLSHALIFSRLY